MALHGDVIPLVVISDFGRDAALRFCAELSQREQEAIARRLPPQAPFYDEYRRLTLRVVGDLPFVKAPWLAAYAAPDRWFDDGVLVGFSGGPPLADIAARIAVLAVEALAGPVARGCEQAIVALPCNTLAPVSEALGEGFASSGGLRALVARAGARPEGLELVGERLAGRIACPTVPGAALAACEHAGSTVVLPLGTAGVGAIYQRYAAACGGALTVVPADAAWQDAVLEAIGASIAGDPQRREASGRALRALCDAARARWGEATAVVEACTDLDYGVGLDSARAYGCYVVEQVYGPGRAEAAGGGDRSD